MYELRIPQRVRNFIKKLPEKYRASSIAALEDIKVNPSIGKPLSRELKGMYSYQFGPYRFVYKFDKKNKIVQVVKLNHRRLVYN
jgi:mRNA-degrading endonuclease RelE of RelBE toxin-antitoxin system